MPVPVRCTCGKQYRVADSARGKRLRCKACGEELNIPSLPRDAIDDETDRWLVKEDDVDSNEEGGARLPPRAGRRVKQKGRQHPAATGRFSTGDLIVRGCGVLVFLATLGNCAYQYQAENAGPDEARVVGFIASGILPILVGGLLGLYIAYVGEETDPQRRSANRFHGAIKCVGGVAMIVLGGFLTWAMSVFAKNGGGMMVVFTGLIISGIGVFAYGGLSLLTGRDFQAKTDRLTP